MKKIINLSLLFFLFVFISNAQDIRQKEPIDPLLAKGPDTLPEFPGGVVALEKYLEDNLKYPQNAKKSGIEGTLYVMFVVDKEGKITNPKVFRGLSEQLDAEAIRVITAMPQWKPGTKNGENVNVEYTIPVSFKL